MNTSNQYSVLMSIYVKENPEFFIQSVESMLNQTVRPDEIVIVKDGPLTEKLDQVINDFIEKEPTLFKVISLEKNIGLGLALNEGLKKCNNELVARMDTDDISLPTRCEKQLAQFGEDLELSICGTMIDEFYGEPGNIITTRIVPTKNEDLLKFVRRRSPFNHVTVMYKKSDVLNCNGGYHNVNRKEDIDLFGRMLNSGCRGMNISESLVLVRSNEDNFERRKSWANCKSYIDVIYSFWKKGYSKTSDLIFVIVSQFVMFISPVWLLKIISNSFLRKKRS